MARDTRATRERETTEESDTWHGSKPSYISPVFDEKKDFYEIFKSNLTKY